MKLFRALWGQAQTMVQHKIPVPRTINNYWEMFRDEFRQKNFFFGIIPGPILFPLSIYYASYAQYAYDVEAVDCVRYDVKLFPNKPERERLHLWCSVFNEWTPSSTEDNLLVTELIVLFYFIKNILSATYFCCGLFKNYHFLIYLKVSYWTLKNKLLICIYQFWYL